MSIHGVDAEEPYKAALGFIEEAQEYERQGEEDNAISAYLRAAKEGDLGRLREFPELNIFPQIYAGLEGRMENIYREHQSQAELSKQHGLRQVPGTDPPVYHVE